MTTHLAPPASPVPSCILAGACGHSVRVNGAPVGRVIRDCPVCASVKLRKTVKGF